MTTSKRLPCGCIPSLRASVLTRCPIGMHWVYVLRQAETDLDHHHALVAIGWHHTSEGQAEAARTLRRAA